MRTLLRHAGGYVLDSLRERVTADDFLGERAARVVFSAHPGAEGVAAIRRLLPSAEMRVLAPGTDLVGLRALRPDVVCLPMTGGGMRGRLLCLLSGARHVLLLPSPDYIYRLGLRRGWAALLWALIDHFLVAPAALLWLLGYGLWAHASGLAARAEHANPTGVAKVVVIQLMPTPSLLALLGRLREKWPGARLSVVHASREVPSGIAEVADRTISTAGLRPLEAVARVRRLAPQVAVLAGGADYGLSPTYLKAALLARLSGARTRWQWELGQDVPGQPLGQAARGNLTTAVRNAWKLLGEPAWDWLARPWRRRACHRPPRRGPRLVQIGITEACNYRCLMCPYHNPAVDHRHREVDQPRMSYQMYARLLWELRRMGARAIDLCGNGEPLTHPEAMEMIALARELGFELTLATNAALLTEARARRLVDLGLRRMHVSINAGSEEIYARMHPGAAPGAFAAIISRLREMAHYAEASGHRPVEVEYSAVLTRLNQHEVVAMVEAAHRARAGWFSLILMGPVTGQPDLPPRPEDWPAIRQELARAQRRAGELGIRTNLDELRVTTAEAGKVHIYHHVPCYIGQEFTLVLGGGRVIFCCHCSRAMGELTAESFAQVWRSETYREARRLAMALPQTKQPVWECGCFEACSHVGLNLQVHQRLHGKRALRSIL